MNQQVFTEVLLTPSWTQSFRQILLLKLGMRVFPIGHTSKYRQVLSIDINNMHGKGHNCVFSTTGVDNSHHLLIANSFEDFLARHLDNLRNNRL